MKNFKISITFLMVFSVQIFAGTINYPDGQYNGIVLNGKKNGLGIMTFQDGLRVKGTWSNDKLIGTAAIKWPNGDYYVGNLQDFAPHGKGMKIFSNGDKYVGDWTKNSMNGYGIYILENGSKYQGSFSDDQKHGSGILISINETKTQGEWFADELVKIKTAKNIYPEPLMAAEILSNINPVYRNDDDCEPTYEIYLNCKFKNLDKFSEEIIKGMKIDWTYRETESEGEEGEILKNITYDTEILSPQILKNVVMSGRFSVDNKFANRADSLRFIKILLGNYDLYENKDDPCTDDGCFEDSQFEITLIKSAASQCSMELLSLFKTAGMTIDKSDLEEVNQLVIDKMANFEEKSEEYKKCDQAYNFLD